MPNTSPYPLPHIPPPLQIKDGEMACFGLLILGQRGIKIDLLFYSVQNCSANIFPNL